MIQLIMLARGLGSGLAAKCARVRCPSDADVATKFQSHEHSEKDLANASWPGPSAREEHRRRMRIRIWVAAAMILISVEAGVIAALCAVLGMDASPASAVLTGLGTMGTMASVGISLAAFLLE